MGEEVKLLAEALRRENERIVQHYGSGNCPIEQAYELLASACLKAMNRRAPSAEGGVEAILAEARKPLEGRTHGAWDRGFRDGLKEAARILAAMSPAEPARPIDLSDAAPIAWQSPPRR